MIAACWDVAARTGAALAPARDRAAETLRQEEALRNEVTAQLAGARASAPLMAGLPMQSGGATINRLCGSSLQALNQAAHSIIAGAEDVQIVGGLEHMQHIPMDIGIDLNPKLFDEIISPRPLSSR